MKLMKSEATQMLLRYPNAFTLITIIAMRAKRESDHGINGLEIGEALIGDFKNYGLTLSTYRTAKEQLVNHKLIAIRTTTKGTIAKLIGTAVYDLNIDDNNEQHRKQIASESQTDSNQGRKQIATNKNKELKNKELLPPTPLKGESEINLGITPEIEIQNQEALGGGEIHSLRKWIARDLPNVSKMPNQLTNQNCEDLIADFGKKVIQDVLESMENMKGVQKKYTSVNLTIRNWAKRRIEEHPELKPKPQPVEMPNWFPQADE